MFISTEHHSSIERLATHLEDGSVAPVIGARFSLEDAIDAMRLLESGSGGGKIAIVVADDEDAEGVA